MSYFHEQCRTGTVTSQAKTAINSFLDGFAGCVETLPEECRHLGAQLEESDFKFVEECYNLVSNETPGTSKSSVKNASMVSILETIKLSPKDISNRTDWNRLPLKPLSLTTSYFAQPQPASLDYGCVWEKFLSELKLIQSDTIKAFGETCLSLLEKHASHVPFHECTSGDVSLFDAVKMACAFAYCLSEETDGANPFLLIGADLSGIQKYIYRVISKYAGVNLKGRSYYLRLLSDAVVRFILKRLELPLANVIYNSGGGFYILAPNSKGIQEKFTQIVSEIEEHMFKTHGLSLFVAIDAVPLSKDILLHQNPDKTLPDCWRELFEKRDQRKRCRYASTIEQDYAQFFSPRGDGSELRDMITGEVIPSDEAPFRPGKRDGEYFSRLSDLFGKVPVLRQATGDQILLGRYLKEMDIVVVSGKPIPYEGFYINPAGLGIYYYFLKKSEMLKIAPLLNSLGEEVSVIVYNGDEAGELCFPDKAFTNRNNSFGFQFYGGKMRHGKTFEDFCKNHDKEGNDTFKRLGILRMDVDNLGSIFQGGICEERANMARYSALSRSFDYFFSGYLNTLQKEFEDTSCILYSGGDDLFIIGDWNCMIAFAKRIHEDFGKYTCGNPAFSISGGISILPVKYPVIKGAYESGEEEENAKGHSYGNESKNAVSFMGYALNWEYEFPAVEALKDTIVALDKKGALPSSFRSKVLAHLASAGVSRHKIGNVKTYWMLTYDFSRMKERLNDGGAHRLLDTCLKEVCGNAKALNGREMPSTAYHPLELWGLACRWAELEIRSNN